MSYNDEAPEVVARYSNSTCGPCHHDSSTFSSLSNPVFGALQTRPRQETEIDATLGISQTPSVQDSSTVPPFPQYHARSETRLPVWAPGSLCLGTLAEKDLPRLTVDSESLLALDLPQKQAALDIGLEETCLLRYFVEDLAKWVRVT